MQQYKDVRHGGEVGIILYYVGLIMPEVDRRLIQLAEELDFVLICMPETSRTCAMARSYMRRWTP